MPIANLADRNPRWFIFLSFTTGQGWAWSNWQWITTFQAMDVATSPAPGVTDLRVYYWDGANVAPAFTE